MSDGGALRCVQCDRANDHGIPESAVCNECFLCAACGCGAGADFEDPDLVTECKSKPLQRTETTWSEFFRINAKIDDKDVTMT